MGKGSEFSSQPMITPDKLSDAISDILAEYGDVIFIATEDGLDAASDVLIRNLKAASPKKSGKFAKNWKSKGRKYKLRRYIGNSTTVFSDKHGEIALANILEYSTTRAKPFIKETFENSVPEMAQAMVNKVKEGV